MLSRVSSLFIDRITKKRLIRSIPCKRKKKSISQHTPEFIDAPPRGERSELNSTLPLEVL